MSLVIARPGSVQRPDDNLATHFEITCSDGHIRVTVAGELDDCNTDRLRECLGHAVDDGMRDIVIDIGEVTYMDSRALSVFVVTHGRMAEVGGSFVICGTTPLNARLFKAADLSSYLADWRDERDAG
jgi:stage II sporulation protein AA (anti-sigma F factor antagonist)